jgi:hypothetical protein
MATGGQRAGEHREADVGTHSEEQRRDVDAIGVTPMDESVRTMALQRGGENARVPSSRLSSPLTHVPSLLPLRERRVFVVCGLTVPL